MRFYFLCSVLYFPFIWLFGGLQDNFEDTKEVIRIRKSKKVRQYNGQMKKGETPIYKIFHRRSSNTNPTINGGGVNVHRWFGKASNSCSTCDIRGVTLLTRWCRKDTIMVATVTLSKWWMQLNTCKVMLVSDIYQFAKNQHQCTWITSDNCSASILVTQIEIQLTFNDMYRSISLKL